MPKKVKTVVVLRDYMLHYVETNVFPTRKAALEYAIEQYKAEKASFYAIEDEASYCPFLTTLKFRYIGNIKSK